MGRRDKKDAIDVNRKERGRTWVAYDKLEEYHAGMWKRVGAEREQVRLMALAVRLLRDTAALEQAMRRVVTDWPVSTKSEFTRAGNHAAWLGQAACCITHGVPEDLTRRAWWKLTEQEQESATEVAERVEREWAESASGGQMDLWGRK